MDEALKIAVARWLEKAANDLRTAETMISVAPPVTDTTCFHAQQCAEKGLKAFLTLSGQHIEKTHNLPRLVTLCTAENASFEQLVSIAEKLTDYALVGRYPDDWHEISVPEAEAAVKMAKEAFEFVKDAIEKGKRNEKPI